ncbi:MAG: DNA mismatch repair protein MutS [Spirochaetes bacterium]|nr:MAG: DNA mismatch repair protein MutS [Spirochaetota bacterium]
MENKRNDPTLTPLMRQYLDIKKKHPNEILFFRLGDFYEMFFEDARVASKALDIVLTSRQNDIPMCGIPYHASESYIARLIKAGHRVAICEQMEATPSSGTVVRRDVVRVITPGTVIEQNLLAGDDNNFLASIVLLEKEIGLAFVDVSTGDFFLSAIPRSLDLYRGEIARFAPREAILHGRGAEEDEPFAAHVRARNIPVNRINDWLYDIDYMTGTITQAYALASVKGLGITGGAEILAAGSILEYLKDTHRRAFDHLKLPQRIVSSDRMILDEATIAHLELIVNAQDGTKHRTLFALLNRARTPMGRRALERALLQPLLLTADIERRLDIVQYFFEYHGLLDDVRAALSGVMDIERVLTRIAAGRVNPRDLLAIARSARSADAVRDVLSPQPHELVAALAAGIPPLGELAARIEATIEDEPALSPEHGRVVRKGYSPELDRLYELKKDARTWVIEYQEEQKRELGIPTLRVKYNRVLGYYIEVSKGQAVKVPSEYLRKQTLVGAERYTTETLQKFEEDILSSSEKIKELEEGEIRVLTEEIVSARSALQAAASAVAEIDLFASLAASAIEHRFTRPRFNEDGITDIREGRHPVVERYYTQEVFIPNDLALNAHGSHILLLTGPNMSGKSTYIRMAAVIQLMAQIGSFVPAASADLTPVDRIFTRIGSSDNISRGESTFLVEMNETAVILNNATPRSLIIMDEVGRGTSTFDGLSIAWAVLEYILRYIKAKTLFATHYHELTKLGEKPGVANYNVLVREHLGAVEFLHKVGPGTADKSYGIHVARLAGIPREITARAAKILERLEKSGRAKGADEQDDASEQLEMFNAANHLVIRAIQAIDLDSITPLDAINELNRLKKLIT